MGERALYVAALISIAGLLGLAYFSETLEPPISEISHITTNDLGRNVHLRGTVNDVHEFKGGSIILKLEDSSGVIDVYLPYNLAVSFKDEISGQIDIIGEVQVYEGRLEVFADDLEKLK